MVPIHDSDVAENRWSQAEWEHYELWEKIERRARRVKSLWIAGTVILFLIISSVPIIRDQFPRWRGVSRVRRLAGEINWMKRQSIISRSPHRIVLLGANGFEILKVRDCLVSEGERVKEGEFLGADLTWLDPARAQGLGLPGFSKDFCYDPLQGSDPSRRGSTVIGFGLIPESDVESSRLDRLAVLYLRGPSGELTFE